MKTALVIVVALAAVAVPSVAHGDVVRSCPLPDTASSTAPYPYPLMTDASVRNMRCTTLVYILHRSRATRNGGLIAPGFKCRTLVVLRPFPKTEPDYILGSTIRCTRPSDGRAFRFKWAT